MNDNNKKALEILLSALAKQQTVITELVKRAQVAPAHKDEVTHGLTDKQVDPTRGHEPPPQSLPAPNAPRVRDAEAILKFLPPVVRAAVRTIQVQPSRDPQFDAIVKVLFNPGKSSDAAFAAVQKVITTLQQQNVLQGKSYNVQEVA